jgi:Dockerin type I domain
MRSRVLLFGVTLLFATTANAINVGIDPSATWLGFMNVSELPANGGAYVFGSAWGVPDLTATFSGAVLTLGPNSVNDPNPFWYTPSGGPGATGNKICDANIYQEKTDTFAGQQVIFTGTVLANTLANGYTSMAFIKDFAPDYSSFRTASVALTPGVFSVSLATGPQPGRHVQFGFETIGPDVWITDRAPIGTVKVTTGPGDFNQNGVVDAGDIAAMATALTDEPTFAAGHGLTTAQLALIGDLDGDGKFTNADLPVLLAQLSVGGGSLASVPEPASIILLAVGGLSLATSMRRWKGVCAS